MEASELMHGDWIRRRWIAKPSGTEVVKDFQVDQLRRLHTTDEVLYVYSKNGNMGRVDQMEPIPLTEEILEKNGFEWSRGAFPEDEHYLLEITRCSRGIMWTINGAEYDILPLLYVHELQHTLKICRIKKKIVI